MELSIVLVIIGLLVGGILAGADLIKAAKLNKIISEREQIITAMNTFYLKYNCIPGDCYNISTYLSGETNGNGDEMILYASAAGGAGEMFAAWKQMAAAGLYPGSYSGLAGSGGVHHSQIGINTPGSKAIAKAGYSFDWVAKITSDDGHSYTGAYGNIIRLGKETTASTPYDPTLKPVDAYNIDKKVDDGIPGAGKVLSYGADIGTCSTSGSSRTSPASSTYYITNDSIACRLAFLTDW